LFGIWGAVSATQTPVPYVKIVSAWFDRGRGLAIGLILLGSALGTTLLPLFTQFVISRLDWRHAFIYLGLACVCIALPPQLLLIKWPPPPPAQRAAGNSAAPHLDRAATLESNDLSLQQALQTVSFWGIAAAIFLVANVIMGLQVHLFALLKDRGFSDSAAILAVSVAGISMIAGRLISGLALDNFRTNLVAAVFFALPEISLGLLWQPTGAVGAALAAAVLGMCSGGEVAVAAVLLLKLFGQRAFGKIYSCVFFAFAIGCGTGPWLMATVFERTRSYAQGLGVLAAFAALAGLLAVALGEPKNRPLPPVR
jgi:sugar phosphate permease